MFQKVKVDYFHWNLIHSKRQKGFREYKIFKLVVNIGDSKSIITHPARYNTSTAI